MLFALRIAGLQVLPNVIRLVSVSHRYERTDHSVLRLGFNFGFFNRASNAQGGQSCPFSDFNRWNLF